LSGTWRRAAPAATAFLAAALALIPAACEKPNPDDDQKEATGMAITLKSTAFGNNERIPVKYTGEGDDVSPPLEWSEPPAGTKSFALVCDDPDAPRGTWDHWVLWNLPASLRKLPENVARTPELPDLGGAVQGNNSWPHMGYNGPMPPPKHGTHHYNFVLYALDTTLNLAPGADKKALLAAMKGHILGQGKLTGTYSR